MQRIDRAEFLRGDWTGRTRATPLPWSIPVPAFHDACIRCDACIEVCPQSIVNKGANGYPEIDFLQGTCTLCGNCAQVCEHGAFQMPAVDRRSGSLQAAIRTGCLAQKNIDCQVCGEACAVDAIGFRPTVGKAPQPEVDIATCTGCGECFRYCPVGAIQIRRAEFPRTGVPS